MGFSFTDSIPVLTVFVQGLLSFFSPCILPLVPLYVSYLAGGAKTVSEDGTIRYPKKRILINTFFFVLGISFTFFLLGYGFTALGHFFRSNQTLFARISGVIMILFGLYQLGIFGQSSVLEREHRLPFLLSRFTMGPFAALLLGFTFSFAWTPCVGPTLGSVLLMAGSASTGTRAFLLIAVYTAGFILPFLAVGLFTGTVLDFFRRHAGIVRYTVKISALLLILMGIMTLTGFMNGITGYLSGFGSSENSAIGSENPAAQTDLQNESSSSSEAVSPETAPPETVSPETAESPEPETVPAPDFSLADQYGNVHSLSDYKGKTIFMNFWATWCPPCRSELPDIEQLYQDHDCNQEDIIVLGIAGPGIGREGSIDDITAFLTENNYTFPVLMDTKGVLFGPYGIQAFPTTFMIDDDGNVFGYAQGALTRDIMDSIIEQTQRKIR